MGDPRDNRAEGDKLLAVGHNQDLKDAQAERDLRQEVKVVRVFTKGQQEKNDLESKLQKNQFETKEVIEQKVVEPKTFRPDPDPAEPEGANLSEPNGPPSTVQPNDSQYSGQLAIVDPVLGKDDGLHG